MPRRVSESSEGTSGMATRMTKMKRSRLRSFNIAVIPSENTVENLRHALFGSGSSCEIGVSEATNFRASGSPPQSSV
jgi:hypothetical protein